MSEQNQELDWDKVLGEVETQEQADKDDPNSKSDFDALPAGSYEVVVQESEKKTSGAGNEMIKVRLQVVEGPYANRVLFGYIVFSKGSPKAMRITLEKLAAFGVTRESIGIHKPSIEEIAASLEGRRAIAKVGIQESGDYKGSNEVKGFGPSKTATDQPAPVFSGGGAAAAQPGVPNIPQPEASAPAATTPQIPLPEVPVGSGDDAADPFGN